MCTAAETSIHVAVTWAEGPVILDSYTSDYANSLGPILASDDEPQGVFGDRTFTICVTASATGFSSGSACNVLTGL